MTTLEIESIDLKYESFKFRHELRSEFSIYNIDQYKTGNWEYKGSWYFNKYELYIAILAHEAAEQFGISDIAALIAVLSGQPFIPTRAKFKGATKGTSVASKYLSKIPGKSPIRLPMATGLPKVIGGNGIRVAFTKIIGKFVGRAVPFIGWGILAYDIGAIFYNTQVIFNEITDEK